jgi:predicted alpha/beta hydrolase family esterase
MSRSVPRVTFRTHGDGTFGEEPDYSDGAWLRRDRIVLMVHGYNVSEDAGRDAFDTYAALVRLHASSLVPNLRGLTWPGDWDVRLPFWILRTALRPAIYSRRVHTARDLAPHLARYLQNLRAPDGGKCTIVLVGHSLGCRLILETLKYLPATDDENPVSHVILMAAAVPVAHVYESGELLQSVKRADTRIVLHSTDDTVLRRYFRPGQLAARDGGLWPEAVGLRGHAAAGLWSPLSRQMVGYDHGDYWGSYVAARVLAEALGVLSTFGPIDRAAAQARPIASHGGLTERDGIGTRVTPERRVS